MKTMMYAATEPNMLRVKAVQVVVSFFRGTSNFQPVRKASCITFEKFSSIGRSVSTKKNINANRKVARNFTPYKMNEAFHVAFLKYCPVLSVMPFIGYEVESGGLDMVLPAAELMPDELAVVIADVEVVDRCDGRSMEPRVDIEAAGW